MKRFVRVLLGVAGLLVLLVIASAVVVATIDKRELLAPLTARLEQATGRKLTLGAEPRIDISLTPTLVLEDVTFANAPWGTRPDMLRAKRVEAQVALLPLLSRTVDIRRFTLVEPSILLETDANGTPNWAFGPAAGGPSAQGSAGAAAGALAVGELVIERGAVDYRDGRTGSVTPIRIQRLYVRGRDPASPMVAQFKGSIDAVPIEVEGAFGPLAALRAGQWPWPVSLKGEVAGRKAEVQGKLRAAPDLVEAQEVVIVSGETRLTGTIARQERRGGRALLRFDLSADVLRPQDLAMAAAATAGAQEAKAAKAARAHDPHLFPATPFGFAGLRSVDAQGSVAVASLRLADGRTLGPLRAKVSLDGGRLVVDDIVLAAHGGTIRGGLLVDARETTPVIGVRLDGRELDLEGLLAAVGVRRAIAGAKSDLALDLAMRGTSPRAWAASVTGTVTLKVGPGSLPTSDQGLTAELNAMLDALNPLRRSSERVALSCAVVRLPFEGGVARVAAQHRRGNRPGRRVGERNDRPRPRDPRALVRAACAQRPADRPRAARGRRASQGSARQSDGPRRPGRRGGGRRRRGRDAQGRRRGRAARRCAARRGRRRMRGGPGTAEAGNAPEAAAPAAPRPAPVPPGERSSARCASCSAGERARCPVVGVLLPRERPRLTSVKRGATLSR